MCERAKDALGTHSGLQNATPVAFISAFVLDWFSVLWKFQMVKNKASMTLFKYVAVLPVPVVAAEDDMQRYENSWKWVLA